MTKKIIHHGAFVGRGATLNIELGFIPDSVELFNATDGDLWQKAYLGWIVPFTSGGVKSLLPGSIIKGVTSKAQAIVQEVLLASGSFAGGDAAGFLVLQEGSLVGTFGSENVVIQNDAGGAIGTDDANVTVNVVHNCAIGAAAASATGTSAMSRYEGVAAQNARGFTVGSVLAENGKVHRYVAYRNDE